MSEEKPTNPLGPPTIPDIITLQVICDMKNGQILVKGPIHIKVLCIKILADAIQIVVDQPAIVPPQANGNAPSKLVHPGH